MEHSPSYMFQDYDYDAILKKLLQLKQKMFVKETFSSDESGKVDDVKDANDEMSTPLQKPSSSPSLPSNEHGSDYSNLLKVDSPVLWVLIGFIIILVIVIIVSIYNFFSYKADDVGGTESFVKMEKSIRDRRENFDMQPTYYHNESVHLDSTRNDTVAKPQQQEEVFRDSYDSFPTINSTTTTKTLDSSQSPPIKQGVYQDSTTTSESFPERNSVKATTTAPTNSSNDNSSNSWTSWFSSSEPSSGTVESMEDISSRDTTTENNVKKSEGGGTLKRRGKYNKNILTSDKIMVSAIKKKATPKGKNSCLVECRKTVGKKLLSKK
jgi:hypothetical protein